MFNRLTSLTLAVVALNLAACAGAETPADNGSGSTALAKEGVDPNAVCVASFKRQRDCTDTFIPALVDLRVRLNKPAGIADAAKTEGRDAIITQANEEWKDDSTDEAIARTCTRIASSAGAAMADAMNGCLAHSNCGEFVPCEVKILEAKFNAE